MTDMSQFDDLYSIVELDVERDVTDPEMQAAIICMHTGEYMLGLINEVISDCGDRIVFVVALVIAVLWITGAI